MAIHAQWAPSSHHRSGHFFVIHTPLRCGKIGATSLRKLSMPTTPNLACKWGRTQLDFKIARQVRKYLRFRALTEETLHQFWPPLENILSTKLNLMLEAARTEEKLQAAATLRARSFYIYPEGRSPDALKAHQKMKADDEWATLTRKIGGMEPGFKHTTCLIACCLASDLFDFGKDLQPGCKITSPTGEECVVVGTLDIRQGLALPGELPGDHPQGPGAEHGRAYVSNVCVAQEVRRRGVGLALMQHVKKVVKLWGVSDLYVHVVVENTSARKLYEKAGFIYEKEESVKDARSMSRPRRYLLRAQL